MMRLTVEVAGRSFIADARAAVCLAIPLLPDGAQPHAFGAPAASARVYEAHGFVGSVARGGSCNVGRYELVPHCNGTHTECIGHITAEPVSVNDVLRETLFPATLITVGGGPVSAEAVEGVKGPFARAVVIRTLPNDAGKRTRDWDALSDVPYLTAAAAQYLADIGCEHVVLDLPSADPMADGGKLLAHRAFFGAGARARRTTITELAYIPDSLADGTYLLDLQIPALVADAAPSRPFLLPLSPL